MLVALLMAGAGSIQRIREARYPEGAVAEETLYLTSGATLQRLTAGYNALAADLYWIRAIHHFGGVKLRLTGAVPGGVELVAAPTDYRLLYPLLDITTTLDPKFNIAYRFGAVFLAEAFPGGAGRPDLAIALLEKGLRARPDKWEYMQDIGFVHYWWRHDYQAAAGWFERAANVPGAPWFLKSLAATTLAEGGDRESSRTMWQAIRESAEIEWLRNDAERRLTQLRAMDEIDELQRRSDRVTAASGRPVSDWSEVVGGIPVDPTGVPYELEAGRVMLSRSSPLFPLPAEPQRMLTSP
ncbi:MAG: hypothetical protein GEU82_07405 [Luteitalea sp.]|nr:hypothetical protein [Luteitalea sp.]